MTRDKTSAFRVYLILKRFNQQHAGFFSVIHTGKSLSLWLIKLQIICLFTDKFFRKEYNLCESPNLARAPKYYTFFPQIGTKFWHKERYSTHKAYSALRNWYWSFKQSEKLIFKIICPLDTFCLVISITGRT